jgi:uncharacterized protein
MQLAGAGCFVTAVLLSAACSHEQAVLASSRPVVRLVADTTTSQPLAAEYARSLPNIEVRVVEAAGSGGTVSAILRGDADLGFVLADVAYFANHPVGAAARSSDAQLRGIAALQTAPVHVLARHGVTLSEIAQLAAPRIVSNAAFSSQSMLAALVLGAYGLDAASLRPPLAATALADGFATAAVDAAFVTAYYPAQSVSAATTRGARLLSIDGSVAEGLRRKYPFVRRVTIPAHTYPGQQAGVRTIGVDRLLVCRSDLDELLVHALTRHFMEALPRIFASLRASVRLMDLDQASATPIPLHKGAAQYYRERELMP